MFATKNTPKMHCWLILFSLLLCLSPLQAQQPSDKDSTEERRVERLGDVQADEWQMDLSLPANQPRHTAKPQSLELPDEAQNRQLKSLISRLASNPDNSETISELNTLLTDVLGQANDLIAKGLMNQADQLLDIIQSVNPGFDGLAEARNQLLVADEVTNLLIAGNAALESGRLLEPESNNARYYFNRALTKSPGNTVAQQGIIRLQRKLLDLALESARELDFETAELWLSDASSVLDDQAAVEQVRNEVALFKRERADELEQRAVKAMNSGNFGMAEFNIIDLIALGGNEERVVALREKLKEARYYGGYVPGQIIQDQLQNSTETAPQVVVISEGSFLMGSRRRSGIENDHELPQHRVTLEQGFGLGVKEVTVEEFRLFVQQTEYQTTAEQRGTSFVYDESAGRLARRSGVNWRHDYNGNVAEPDLPVLHISFYDAHAYLQWLSVQTGQTYRLPSEAEYEYVARGGGKSVYWWGDGSPSEVVENLTGERDFSPGKRQWTTFFKKYGDGYWGPGPAGSINQGKLLHPMGVHDIAGNVSEWVEDCWHQNYIKAPVDGSAWVNPGCKQRVVRGGYWSSAPEKTRAAFRFPVKADSYGPVIGFRVARDL